MITRKLVAGCLWAVAGLALCLADAVAQSPAPVPATPPAVAPSPPRDSPGFLDAFNRWIDQSAANFRTGVKDAQNKLSDFGAATGDAAKAAKEATDSLVKLGSARFVDGRERCQTAPNGSPDCRGAAELICRGKGFNSGRSVDTQSAQKCPARIWLSGKLPAEGECAVETHVIRAVCQ
ncbi:MAG: hypothetical protein AB7K04_16130 [Pseudorhodoplanes sp.]